MRRIALLLLLFAGTAGAWDDGEYAPGGDRSCIMCHASAEDHPLRGIHQTPHGRTGDAGAPEAGMQCQACHGPSAAHLSVDEDGRRPPPPVSFRRDEPAELRNKPCRSCHEGYDLRHWAGSGHEFAEVACSDCHQSHTPDDPVMRHDTRNAVCLDCHTRVRAEIHRPSSHPMRRGEMSCTDCHAPHGSISEGELKAGSVNETCYSCHAEFRGPFLWEHPPVRENCMNCHNPHGSVHANLLTARGPQLCQTCHSATFHPSAALDGSGVPPQGASSSMLMRNCMNCHTQVHGSNHPSGIGQTR